MLSRARSRKSAARYRNVRRRVRRRCRPRNARRRYTLLNEEAAADLLPLAVERGVGVVIAGVYNSGLLSSQRPAAGAKFDYEHAPDHLIARANAIADVCQWHGVSLPAAAIAFPLLHSALLSVVVGVRDAARVSGNVERLVAVRLERNLARSVITSRRVRRLGPWCGVRAWSATRARHRPPLLRPKRGSTAAPERRAARGRRSPAAAAP